MYMYKLAHGDIRENECSHLTRYLRAHSDEKPMHVPKICSEIYK